MTEKIKVGILGGTGMVGQNYIRLLDNHPWFEVSYIAASPRSAGQKYSEAVAGRWQMSTNIPKGVRNIVVEDASNVDAAKGKVSFMFSAMDLPDKKDTRALEFKYAETGIPVVSNSSANRWTEDVPMLIPEINHEHINIIEAQKKNRNLEKGFVAVKPNCSLQSYVTAIFALEQAGFKVDKIILTTLQAVSGAGYPGVPSLDMVDNLVPVIGGEEEKTEKEPYKIFGSIQDGKIVNDESIKISSTTTRVPVVDGHTACVSVKFKDKIPTKEEILKIWKDFKSVPQELKLPFAPEQPIIYLEEENRPQPRKDRDNGKGMALTAGRLRECKVFDWRFVALSHNTVRGAAGGGILNAELLKAKGYLK
ncbi:aspartate-semialdehyde dehydrogenase [Nanoarchaeota archaeon]